MRHSRTNSGGLLLAALIVLATATALHADRIATPKGIAYNGEMTGVAPDGLVINTSNDIKRTVPLTDVQRIKADAFPDLDKAEQQYADGLAGNPEAWKAAEKLYLGMAKTAPPWLKAVIQFRMFKLYGESGRIKESLDAYLDLAKIGPRLVEGMKLPSPQEGDHAGNKVMLKKVDDALKAAAGKPYAGELNGFRVNLLMYEGKPEEVLPLLDPLLKSPDEQTRQAAQLKQIELFVAIGRMGEASTRMAEAGKTLDAAYPADVAYVRGRILEDQKKPTEAALEYMRLPILHGGKNRNRTAEALWRAGLMLEAAKAAPAEAVAVYKEAVSKYAGTVGADSAKKELARLGVKK